MDKDKIIKGIGFVSAGVLIIGLGLLIDRLVEQNSL
jgi:hypothetical protein